MLLDDIAGNMITFRELLGLDSDSLDVGFTAGDLIEEGLEGRERLCEARAYICEVGQHKTKTAAGIIKITAIYTFTELVHKLF